jgi:anti-anti-sigma regulatory factor
MKAKSKTLKLNDILDIKQSEALYELLQGAISAQEEVIALDASHIVKITTPCVQLLVCTKMFCEKQGYQFCINNPSAEFISAIADLSLTDMLLTSSGGNYA